MVDTLWRLPKNKTCWEIMYNKIIYLQFNILNTTCFNIYIHSGSYNNNNINVYFICILDNTSSAFHRKNIMKFI